jgi:hypothetical protein
MDGKNPAATGTEGKERVLSRVHGEYSRFCRSTFTTVLRPSKFSANSTIVVENVYDINLAFLLFGPKATARDLLPLQRYMKETKEEEPWHIYNLRSDASPDLQKGTALSKRGER